MAAVHRESSGANAGAELDRALTVAAAGCRRQQDGVVADAMAAARLAQLEAAAEHGVERRIIREIIHRD
jgi:hypothetical protein